MTGLEDRLLRPFIRKNCLDLERCCVGCGSRTRRAGLSSSVASLLFELPLSSASLFPNDVDGGMAATLADDDDNEQLSSIAAMVGSSE